jgi:hypothetical protein
MVQARPQDKLGFNPEMRNGESAISVRDASGTAALSEDLWIFIHIPKTAGSSFRLALANQLKPEYNISIDKVRGTKKRDDAFREAIDQFLAKEREMHFRFASGHIKMVEAYRIRQAIQRPVKFITILRDPADRVISEFRYQTTPVHPQHMEFIQVFPTLESFISHPRSQNKMRRHLALSGETIDETISRLEKDISLVGVIESYSEFVKRCSEVTGRSLHAEGRERVTQKTTQNDIQITDELYAQIRQLNQLDQRLWEHFKIPRR